MTQVNYDSIKPHNEWIERKAVDTSGRLGSLYNAYTDTISHQQTIPASQTNSVAESSICRLFSGKESYSRINHLKWMDFNNAIQQSILFGLVMPSGISSLVNHSQVINEKTRFLYYSYRSKQEELRLESSNIDQITSLQSFLSNATHVITKIIWGFELVCIITIPDYQSSDVIDSLLNGICKQLKNSWTNLTLRDHEQQRIAQLYNVTVYGSDMCDNNPNTSLLTVLSKIKDWQNNDKCHHPLKYTMFSLRCLYNASQFPEFLELSDEINSNTERIESIIANLDIWKKYLQQLFGHFPQRFAILDLNQRLQFFQSQFMSWLDQYEEFRKQCRNILIGVRQRGRLIEVDNLMSMSCYSSLQTIEIEKFSHYVYEWFLQATLLERLKQNQVVYINMANIRSRKETPMTLELAEKAIYNHLSKDSSSVFVLYSNDRLKRTDPVAWEKLYNELISRRQQREQGTILVYADFTHCSYHLEHLTIVNLLQQAPETIYNHFTDKLISPNYSPTLEDQPKKQPPSDITEINVLLLGETGVGKSTFINAFVNYLLFDTLQQAEQSQPVALIPVSFLTTVGHQFDEVKVKFGPTDSNEDFEHEGQSVTQQCKSYVVHLNDRYLLRLIDTPGMGDTRGLDQDDKNIQHILTYVNSLSHINAICLLLKPNTSRLNIFFRSCIRQLFTYLTPVGYQNIIFCFTNARSTFYAPGDTAPLLKQMLKQEHLDDIPFQKQNSFCFDSESFRYLAARKYGVDFDDFQKEECTHSWTVSVRESVRLLDHILQREPYHLNEWQSPRKAALEIAMLARPLMETLRLIIYNWMMCEAKVIDKQIILESYFVKTETCSNCVVWQRVDVGPFSIIQYHCVSSETNTTRHHQCSLDGNSFAIEYIVKHNSVNKIQDRTVDQWHQLFDDLLFKCDTLSYFLRQQGFSDLNDPFASIVERFLEEDGSILNSTPTFSFMNRRVYEVLSSINELRIENIQRLNQSNSRLSLNEAYGTINELKAYESVKKQMNSIIESRQLKMKTHEHRIETNFVKNKAFTELNTFS